MSLNLFEEITSFLGLAGAVANITTDIEEAEKATVAGLTAFSVLITAGAAVADGVSAELGTLLPNLKTAIANADAKVDGWAVALKAEIAKAQAWLAARTVTNTAGAEAGTAGLRVSLVHIS